jgi:hypothetical protein
MPSQNCYVSRALKDVFPLSELFLLMEEHLLCYDVKYQNNLPLLISDTMLIVRITEIFHPDRAVTEYKRLYEFHHYYCSFVSSFTEGIRINNEGPDKLGSHISYDFMPNLAAFRVYIA